MDSVPWSFADTITSQAGIAAAVLFVCMCLAGVAAVILLRVNMDLTKKLSDKRGKQGKGLQDPKESTAPSGAEHHCEAAHRAIEVALEKFREGIAEDARKYQATIKEQAARIDELQELRVKEGRTDQQAMAKYIASIDHNISKFGTTHDVMVELMRRTK